jgi:hypothetical protein
MKKETKESLLNFLAVILIILFITIYGLLIGIITYLILRFIF